MVVYAFCSRKNLWGLSLTLKLTECASFHTQIATFNSHSKNSLLIMFVTFISVHYASNYIVHFCGREFFID